MNTIDFFTADELNVARQLMFHYGKPGGYAPGDFHFRLIQAMEKADDLNLGKLLTAFPEFRRPVTVLQVSGPGELQELAEESAKYLRSQGVGHGTQS